MKIVKNIYAGIAVLIALFMIPFILVWALFISAPYEIGKKIIDSVIELFEKRK